MSTTWHTLDVYATKSVPFVDVPVKSMGVMGALTEETIRSRTFRTWEDLGRKIEGKLVGYKRLARLRDHWHAGYASFFAEFV